MKRVVLAFFLLSLCDAAAQTQVTVMQLLQSPRLYVGRRVTVRGYYYGDAESQAIYADPAAAKRAGIERGVSVAVLPPVYCRPAREAFVTGIFLYDAHHKVGDGYGAFGLFSSELRNSIVYLPKASNQAMQRTAR